MHKLFDAQINADLDDPDWPNNQSPQAKVVQALQRIEDVFNMVWYELKALRTVAWIAVFLLALILWRVW